MHCRLLYLEGERWPLKTHGGLVGSRTGLDVVQKKILPLPQIKSTVVVSTTELYVDCKLVLFSSCLCHNEII